MKNRTDYWQRSTLAELERELDAGGRFVFFEYCISFVVASQRRASRVYFLPAGRKGLARGLAYSLISLLLGWWGVPWGLVYTPLTVLTNLSGGCDITAQVRLHLFAAQDVQPHSLDTRQRPCAEG